jgi:hypothetical protein
MFARISKLLGGRGRSISKDNVDRVTGDTTKLCPFGIFQDNVSIWEFPRQGIQTHGVSVHKGHPLNIAEFVHFSYFLTTCLF